MASPTPVLPLVGSTIVPPGCSRPSRSAARIISSAGRSFDEPPGLVVSIFMASTLGICSISLIRRSRTSGRVADEVDDRLGDRRAGQAGIVTHGDDCTPALRAAPRGDPSAVWRPGSTAHTPDALSTLGWVRAHRDTPSVVSVDVAWSIEQVVAIAPAPARFAAADAIAVAVALGRASAPTSRPSGGAVGAPGASPTRRWSTTPTWRGAAPARAARTRASTPWPCSIMWVKGQVPDAAGADRRALVGRRPRPPRGRRRRRPAPGTAAPVAAARRRRRWRAAARRPARPRAPARRAHRPPAGRPRRARPVARRPPAHRPRRPGAGPLRHVGRPRRPARRRPRRRARQPGPAPGRRRRRPPRLARGRARRAGRPPPPRRGRPAGARAARRRWPTRWRRRAAGRSARPTSLRRRPRHRHAGSSPVAATPARTASRCAARGCAGRPSGRWAMVLSFAAYRQSLDTSLVVGDAFTADLHRYPGPSWRALDRRPARATASTHPVAPPAARRRRRVRRGRRRRSPPSRGSTGCPATLVATPAFAGGRWVLTDDSGALALAARRPGRCRRCWRRRPAARSRSPSSGRIDGAVPLTVHLRRSGARHRPARRPLVRERGMSATAHRALARAGHGRPARHRPPRPAGAAGRAARRRRRRHASPPRRRRGCWPPSPAAWPPAGPACARSPPAAPPVAPDDDDRPLVAAGRGAPLVVADRRRRGRCSRTSGWPSSSAAVGGCRPTCSSACCGATAPTPPAAAVVRRMGGAGRAVAARAPARPALVDHAAASAGGRRAAARPGRARRPAGAARGRPGRRRPGRASAGFRDGALRRRPPRRARQLRRPRPHRHPAAARQRRSAAAEPAVHRRRPRRLAGRARRRPATTCSRSWRR